MFDTTSPSFTDLTDCAHGVPGAPACPCGREQDTGPPNVPVAFQGFARETWVRDGDLLMKLRDPPRSRIRKMAVLTS
jgi:hypothetical protein